MAVATTATATLMNQRGMTEFRERCRDGIDAAPGDL